MCPSLPPSSHLFIAQVEGVGEVRWQEVKKGVDFLPLVGVPDEGNPGGGALSSPQTHAATHLRRPVLPHLSTID